jgi:hypothetical protein
MVRGRRIEKISVVIWRIVWVRLLSSGDVELRNICSFIIDCKVASNYQNLFVLNRVTCMYYFQEEKLGEKPQELNANHKHEKRLPSNQTACTGSGCRGAAQIKPVTEIYWIG